MPAPVAMWRTVLECNGAGKFESDLHLQDDQALPMPLGGATSTENLRLLCADCNQRKSNSI
jgi:5-methylcytosine-specific restriction endonuclease McrA